jgi:hypothetical protein
MARHVQRTHNPRKHVQMDAPTAYQCRTQEQCPPRTRLLVVDLDTVARCPRCPLRNGLVYSPIILKEKDIQQTRIVTRLTSARVGKLTLGSTGVAAGGGRKGSLRVGGAAAGRAVCSKHICSRISSADQNRIA